MSSKNWYTIAITYKAGPEIKMFRITNMSGNGIKQFRDNVFIGGAYRRIDADTGEIIPPWQITEIMVYKQAYFFNAAEEDKPITKSNAKSINKG